MLHQKVSDRLFQLLQSKEELKPSVTYSAPERNWFSLNSDSMEKVQQLREFVRVTKFVMPGDSPAARGKSLSALEVTLVNAPTHQSSSIVFI